MTESILDKLKQFAKEKSEPGKPTTITKSSLRKMTGIEDGSDIKLYKAFAEEILQKYGLDIQFAGRGSTLKNPNSLQTKVGEDGLFISLEELDKIEIESGDRVKVEYKKPYSRKMSNGKITDKPGSLIITKIKDKFIPAPVDEEDYLEEEESTEEEELFGA